MSRDKICKYIEEYLFSEGNFLYTTDVEERKCREQTGLDTLVVYTVNTEC
jgi:hypothetical protein